MLVLLSNTTSIQTIIVDEYARPCVRVRPHRLNVILEYFSTNINTVLFVGRGVQIHQETSLFVFNFITTPTKKVKTSWDTRRTDDLWRLQNSTENDKYRAVWWGIAWERIMFNNGHPSAPSPSTSFQSKDVHYYHYHRTLSSIITLTGFVLLAYRANLGPSHGHSQRKKQTTSFFDHKFRPNEWLNDDNDNYI